MEKNFGKKGSRLVNLKKKNDVAVMVSNEALTALNWFGIQATSGVMVKSATNDVVRWIYDALYQMNVECDFVWPESENLSRYKAIFVPALLCGSGQYTSEAESLCGRRRYAGCDI